MVDESLQGSRLRAMGQPAVVLCAALLCMVAAAGGNSSSPPTQYQYGVIKSTLPPEEMHRVLAELRRNIASLRGVMKGSDGGGVELNEDETDGHSDRETFAEGGKSADSFDGDGKISEEEQADDNKMFAALFKIYDVIQKVIPSDKTLETMFSIPACIMDLLVEAVREAGAGAECRIGDTVIDGALLSTFKLKSDLGLGSVLGVPLDSMKDFCSLVMAFKKALSRLSTTLMSGRCAGEVHPNLMRMMLLELEDVSEDSNDTGASKGTTGSKAMNDLKNANAKRDTGPKNRVSHAIVVIDADEDAEGSSNDAGRLRAVVDAEDGSSPKSLAAAHLAMHKGGAGGSKARDGSIDDMSLEDGADEPQESGDLGDIINPIKLLKGGLAVVERLFLNIAEGQRERCAAVVEADFAFELGWPPILGDFQLAGSRTFCSLVHGVGTTLPELLKLFAELPIFTMFPPLKKLIDLLVETVIEPMLSIPSLLLEKLLPSTGQCTLGGHAVDQELLQKVTLGVGLGFDMTIGSARMPRIKFTTQSGQELCMVVQMIESAVNALPLDSIGLELFRDIANVPMKLVADIVRGLESGAEECSNLFSDENGSNAPLGLKLDLPPFVYIPSGIYVADNPSFYLGPVISVHLADMRGACSMVLGIKKALEILVKEGIQLNGAGADELLQLAASYSSEGPPASHHEALTRALMSLTKLELSLEEGGGGKSAPASGKADSETNSDKRSASGDSKSEPDSKEGTGGSRSDPPVQGSKKSADGDSDASKSADAAGNTAGVAHAGRAIESEGSNDAEHHRVHSSESPSSGAVETSDGGIVKKLIKKMTGMLRSLIEKFLGILPDMATFKAIIEVPMCVMTKIIEGVKEAADRDECIPDPSEPDDVISHETLDLLQLHADIMIPAVATISAPGLLEICKMTMAVNAGITTVMELMAGQEGDSVFDRLKECANALVHRADEAELEAIDDGSGLVDGAVTIEPRRDTGRALADKGTKKEELERVDDNSTKGQDESHTEKLTPVNNSKKTEADTDLSEFVNSGLMLTEGGILSMLEMTSGADDKADGDSKGDDDGTPSDDNDKGDDGEDDGEEDEKRIAEKNEQTPAITDFVKTLLKNAKEFMLTLAMVPMKMIGAFLRHMAAAAEECDELYNIRTELFFQFPPFVEDIRSADLRTACSIVKGSGLILQNLKEFGVEEILKLPFLRSVPLLGWIIEMLDVVGKVGVIPERLPDFLPKKGDKDDESVCHLGGHEFHDLGDVKLHTLLQVDVKVASFQLPRMGLEALSVLQICRGAAALEMFLKESTEPIKNLIKKTKQYLKRLLRRLVFGNGDENKAGAAKEDAADNDKSGSDAKPDADGTMLLQEAIRSGIYDPDLHEVRDGRVLLLEEGVWLKGDDKEDEESKGMKSKLIAICKGVLKFLGRVKEDGLSLDVVKSIVDIPVKVLRLLLEGLSVGNQQCLASFEVGDGASDATESLNPEYKVGFAFPDLFGLYIPPIPVDLKKFAMVFGSIIPGIGTAAGALAPSFTIPSVMINKIVQVEAEDLMTTCVLGKAIGHVVTEYSFEPHEEEKKMNEDAEEEAKIAAVDKAARSDEENESVGPDVGKSESDKSKKSSESDGHRGQSDGHSDGIGSKPGQHQVGSSDGGEADKGSDQSINKVRTLVEVDADADSNN